MHRVERYLAPIFTCDSRVIFSTRTDTCLCAGCLATRREKCDSTWKNVSRRRSKTLSRKLSSSKIYRVRLNLADGISDDGKKENN